MDEPRVAQVGLDSPESREDHRMVGDHHAQHAGDDYQNCASGRGKIQAEPGRRFLHSLILAESQTRSRFVAGLRRPGFLVPNSDRFSPRRRLPFWKNACAFNKGEPAVLARFFSGRLRPDCHTIDRRTKPTSPEPGPGERNRP